MLDYPFLICTAPESMMKFNLSYWEICAWWTDKWLCAQQVFICSKTKIFNVCNHWSTDSREASLQMFSNKHDVYDFFFVCLECLQGELWRNVRECCSYWVGTELDRFVWQHGNKGLKRMLGREFLVRLNLLIKKPKTWWVGGWVDDEWELLTVTSNAWLLCLVFISTELNLNII